MPDTEPITPELVPQGEPQTPVADPIPTETHPLDPGGARFSEVYRDMQDAKREAARLQGELDASRRQQPQQTQQQPQFYTPNDLQALLDQGKITPAVMTAQIAWQERQIAKQEMRQEFFQAERLRTAGAEVNRYLSEMPKLSDTGSEEFRRVNVLTREIADELQLPAEDPRVQRRALQIAFGPVDKLVKSRVASETTRTQSDTYVESGGGGRGVPQVSKDPLKDIPTSYKAHWEKLGYSHEQMVEEAKYIRPTPRMRAGLWKP